MTLLTEALQCIAWKYFFTRRAFKVSKKGHNRLMKFYPLVWDLSLDSQKFIED